MPGGQNIDKQNLDWPCKKTSLYSLQLKKEWLEFIYETEAEYREKMKEFTRKTCGYSGLIIGTIFGTSAQLQQSVFDLVDAHAMCLDLKIVRMSFPGIYLKMPA